MPLQSPNLDDRRYQDLLDEARRLIPSFTPEWTDHSDSDPGMTLLQLFCWLGEQVIYRLNRVPAKNYVEFLRLVGVRQRPATAARALLSFKLRPGAGVAWVPKGTQVQADTGGDKPVLFETLEDLRAVESELKAVGSGTEGNIALVGAPAKGMPVGTPAARTSAFHALGARPVAGSALYLGFAKPLPEAEDLCLQVLLPEERAGVQSAMVAGPTLSPTQAQAELVWEYYDGTAWQPLEQVLDETLGFTVAGQVWFRLPGAMAAASDLAIPELEEAEQQYYWIRGRMAAGAYERAPQLRAVLANAVWAGQFATVTDEFAGRSSGEPSQTVALAYSPVLDGSLQLEVEEYGAMQPWTEVEDLRTAGPLDRVFSLDRENGIIQFGDGTHGKIPEPGGAVVALSYRQGGGKAGNVAPLLITGLRSTNPAIESSTNPFAATGGDDQESLDAAMKRAPRELKALGRAVTAADFEALALATPGGRIARARVMPLSHPHFPGVRYPGAVSVVVVPSSEEAMPTPTRSTLEEVRRYLDGLRPVTTELYVVPPVYREVTVTARLTLAQGALPPKIQEAALAALRTFFHPLTGGQDGQGWPWGGPVYYSDVFALLQQLEGVGRVQELTVAVDGAAAGACQDVMLNEGELVFSGKHAVYIQGGTPNGRTR